MGSRGRPRATEALGVCRRSQRLGEAWAARPPPCRTPLSRGAQGAARGQGGEQGSRAELRLRLARHRSRRHRERRPGVQEGPRHPVQDLVRGQREGGPAGAEEGGALRPAGERGRGPREGRPGEGRDRLPDQTADRREAEVLRRRQGGQRRPPSQCGWVAVKARRYRWRRLASREAAQALSDTMEFNWLNGPVLRLFRP